MTLAERPRVIFFDHAAAPGGGQLAAFRLISRLQDIDPIVLFSMDGPLVSQYRERGIEVAVLDASRQGLSSQGILIAARQLRKFLSKMPSETPLIALSTASAQVLSLVARNGSKRILRLSEDMDRYKRRGLKSYLYFKRIFPKFDGFIANSEWTQTTIPASLEHISVRLAYPLSGIQSSTRREKSVLSDDVVKISCFSRPVRWKGLDLAIKALGELKHLEIPIELSIYGGEYLSEPEYMDELRTLASASGVSTHFLPFTDDVSSAMAESDIVLLPSRLPEPFGQVTVQALNAGCVVIASAHGGTLELIEDGFNGRMFAPENYHDLARVVEEVIDSPEVARSLAENARTSAAAFWDSELAQKFEAVILQLLEDAYNSDTRP